MPPAGVINRKDHPTTILKRNLIDGRVKVYEDERGAAQRSEILLPNGRVVVIKDYEVNPLMAKYKKIEVFSNDDEPRGEITIIQEGHTLRPTYRFYDGNSPLGRGSGDIITTLAQRLLGDALMDPRYVTADAQVDLEVIEAIKHMLPKSIR